jgi:hypothetical protein
MKKRDMLINHVIQNPDLTVKEAAAAVGASYSYASKVLNWRPPLLKVGVLPFKQAAVKRKQVTVIKTSDRENPKSASPTRDKQIGGSHYKDLSVQPWDVVDTWPIDQRIGYYRGGALKYLMRMGSKDKSVTEISKCIHYMEKLVEVLESVQG